MTSAKELLPNYAFDFVAYLLKFPISVWYFTHFIGFHCAVPIAAFICYARGDGLSSSSCANSNEIVMQPLATVGVYTFVWLHTSLQLLLLVLSQALVPFFCVVFNVILTAQLYRIFLYSAAFGGAFCAILALECPCAMAPGTGTNKLTKL